MVDTGRLTTEQAAADPLRNVLTVLAGAGDDVLESEFQRPGWSTVTSCCSAPTA